MFVKIFAEEDFNQCLAWVHEMVSQFQLSPCSDGLTWKGLRKKPFLPEPSPCFLPEGFRCPSLEGEHPVGVGCKCKAQNALLAFDVASADKVGHLLG